MAGTRWCNVHREDDKVTKWIHENWLSKSASREVMALAMCVARTVNWPDTLEELGFPHDWDPVHFVKVLAERKARGEKVWTGAYMVTGGFSAGGESKEVIIARVLDGAAERCKEFAKYDNLTLAESALLLSTPGIGPFLVAQVVADLKHTSWLYNATDWWTWCSPGPGSTKGLNFLHDRPQTTYIGPRSFMIEVDEVRHILGGHGWSLDAQNVQNCLCEFHKFVKIKYYGGRAKSRYIA